jgi:apolipoprotein N-acyltransferase
MDRKFVMIGLLYAVAGMVLGNVMAATKDHGQLVTHAHIMLVGFVVSFIYGLCHRLWLDNAASLLARVQFWLHQCATVVLVIGLFLFYGGYVPLERIDPVLAGASMVVLLGMILMTYMFARSTKPGVTSP